MRRRASAGSPSSPNSGGAAIERMTPSPFRCLRLPLLSLGLALCGCAAVVVPTEVRFASLKPGRDPAQMVDTRPPAAHEYREQGATRRTSSLPTTPCSRTRSIWSPRASPPRCRQRSAAAHRAAPPRHRLSRPAPILAPRLVDLSLGLPAGSPAAALAAGLLLAYGMIAAFHGSREDESAVAYIEVAIGAASLRTAQTVTVAHSVGAAEAVETAFAIALDDLADQARELKPRVQAMP